MQRTKMVMVLSVVLLMFAAPLAHGQTASPGAGQTASPAASKPASTDDKWQFRVTPYFWAAQIESKVTVGGYSTTVNTYFPDVWRDLKGAGMLNFEGQKGQWGFFVNPLYLKLQADGEFTRVRQDRPRPIPPTRDLTATLESLFVEFGGFYQVGKWPLDWKQGKGRSITLDILAGGRYWYIHANLDTTSPISPSAYTNWVDPIIGARTKMDLTDKLSLSVEGDFGGFDVGSKFTWNAQGSFGYQFTPLLSAFAGYRVLYVDYKGSTRDIQYKETFQGPTAGVTFTF